MPTGMKPYRTLYVSSGGTWTNPQANPPTQTLHIPYYQIRNCPDRLMKKYLNCIVLYVSAAYRQHMANNGYYAEICGTAPLDGPLWQNLRDSHTYWATAGLTNGSPTSMGRGRSDFTNDKDYTGACFGLHELGWAEFTQYFLSGQRPPGKESYNDIDQWPEMISLYNDCSGHGGVSGLDNWLNQMHVSQRVENNMTVTSAIPFNATSSQVFTALMNLPYVSTSDVTCTGGPLPTAITMDFGASGGQYVNATLVPLVVATNSLNTGSPSLSVVTPGQRGFGSPYNITATSLKQNLITTGSPSSGTFVLGFYGGTDRMIDSVGPGVSGSDTPQSRVNQWVTICNNNGWGI